jgi:hypothetical protein
MQNQLFINWNIIRIIRLVLGVFIIIQSFQLENYWIMLPGFIFAGMAVFNAGCGSNCCEIPTSKKHENE